MKNTFLLYTTLLLAGNVLISCKKNNEPHVPVCKVAKGTFYLDVVETGEIQAIKSINISSPNISWRYGSLKITQIVKDGSEVKTGDTVVVFDPSEVKKAIVEAEARLEISYAELEKLKAQQQSEMEELKADYEVTKLSRQISEIQFEASGYEAAIKRKEIQLNLEKANIALNQALEQINNKEKIQAEDIRQKVLSINQDKAKLKEANETQAKLFLTSPSPGIAIIGYNWSTGNKFQTGDQCWSGSPLIQLPNLSKLKATIQVNEVDISKIKTGLKVEIKPDAFSDSIYYGEVTAIANLAITKEGAAKIKVFPVDILLRNTSSKLLPGLSVSCRVLIEKIDDVLSVPVDAVQSDGIRNYVFLQTKNGFKKRILQTGRSNSDHTVVLKGLQKGDVVALANPFAEKEKKPSKKE